MVKIKLNDQEENVPPGAPMREPTEAMGLPYGCETGICGTCEVVVKSGGQHLTPLSPNEKEMGLTEAEPYRLCCQCSLRHDTPDDAVLELEE